MKSSPLTPIGYLRRQLSRNSINFRNVDVDVIAIDIGLAEHHGLDFDINLIAQVHFVSGAWVISIQKCIRKIDDTVEEFSYLRTKEYLTHQMHHFAETQPYLDKRRLYPIEWVCDLDNYPLLNGGVRVGGVEGILTVDGLTPFQFTELIIKHIVKLRIDW